jgi:F0F1-type ATP synthase assembly protein I
MNNDDNKLESDEEDSLDNNESSSLSKAEKHAQLEKIEEIIDAIPVEEKKVEARSILREFTKIIERPSQLDPATVHIITESLDKDNERKFQYLTQKQKDETEIEKQEIDFRREKHRDGFSLVKPIVFFVLILVAICILTGIWLCVNGQPTLGASLITGSLSAVLSFAAGFGTSTFFKNEKK